MGLRKPAAIEPLREVVDREHARDLPGLLQQLRSGNAEQRRWAARDLAAHAPAAAALGEQLLGEQDASVRETLFTTLTAFASDGAVSALLPLLRSEDAQMRNGAIEALSSMPQAVAPRVDALLRDNDPDVRIFTVNMLGDLRHERVVPWLEQVLQDEGQVNVVAAAIEVLAEVGSPADIPALQASSRRFDADPFIGFAARMAIERIEAA
ncbi:HEAT repeat domain-containing protein [Aquabacterium sp. OR-4]|uniref:HEAT repeat domain-containing protein n=1 Tax=Aquabacterium sp. OR-4 TaxID=2978127 RepID=UPI0021B47D76|nr:HEAT repeat domain-containing protein [Aquabacterium sp. OR-4]MDT7835966.1 HEAT repeat domain-containing protein [Aquabacterium sp. OR-4]